MLARDNLIEIMKIQLEVFPKNNIEIAINIMKQINKFYKIDILSNKNTKLSKSNESDFLTGSIILEKTCKLGCIDSYVMFYINYINKHTIGMSNCILYCNTNMHVLNFKKFSQFEKYCILIANYICSLIVNDFSDFFKDVVTTMSNETIMAREFSGNGITEFNKITNKYKSFNNTQKRYDVSGIMKALAELEYTSRVSKNLFKNLDDFLDKNLLTSIFNFVKKLNANVDTSKGQVVSFNKKNNYWNNCENYLEMTDIINYPYFKKEFFKNFDSNFSICFSEQEHSIIKNLSKQDKTNFMVSCYIDEQLPKNKEMLTRIGPQLFEILLLNSKITLEFKILSRVSKYYNNCISKICVELPEGKKVRCGIQECKYSVWFDKGAMLSSRPTCAYCLGLDIYTYHVFEYEKFDVWCECGHAYCRCLFVHTNTKDDYLNGKVAYLGGNPKCKMCRHY